MRFHFFFAKIARIGGVSMILDYGSKIGVIACSNGRQANRMAEYKALYKKLEDKYGIGVVEAKTIYASENSIFSGTPKERAHELHNLYGNQDIQAIIDISGGDVANQILPFLDFEWIRKHKKPFIGYSDLTTILNSIYTLSDMPGVLFHLGSDSLAEFERYFIKGEKVALKGDFMSFDNSLRGILIGGNIRCFLKLAGTPYMPDFHHKILLLEAQSGDVSKMATFIAQYEQLGAFSRCKGLVLGQFTEAEEKGIRPQIDTLFKEIGEKYQLPIFKTNQIGHAPHSIAVPIGQEISIKN